MPSAPTAAQPPARPQGVPEAAEWSASDRTWRVGDVDGQQQPHGPYRIFREAGSIASELTFEHGKREGEFRRFHPNGELARTGRFLAGELDGDVLATASKEPSPEALRACCVPPGAWQLRAVYDRGRCRSELFFDREGRRLLDDGSLYPDHPTSVPETAHFLLERQQWVLGTYGAKGKQGRWTWWSRAGDLVELSDYRDGQRHGDWQAFEAGQVVWQNRHEAGVPHGSFFERVAVGRYVEPSIAQRRGAHDTGVPVGVWRFETAVGQLVCARDFGSACRALAHDHAVFTCSAHGRLPLERAPASDDAGALEQLAARLAISGEAAAAAVAELRAAALAGVPFGPSDVRLTDSASGTLLAELRNSKAEQPERLARLAVSLLHGADPGRVAQEFATLLSPQPRQALALIETALGFDADDVRARVTRIVLAMELGWLRFARAELSWLARTAPDVASTLQLSLRANFPTFDFWPESMSFVEQVMEQLPTSVEQDLRAFRQTIAKAALRMTQLREALVNACMSEERDWFPPDLAHLVTQASTLESFSFEITEPGEEDTVVVDERLELRGQSVTRLMRRARQEWGSLCWLCWSAGQTEVCLPETLLPQARFGAGMNTAFARHWRAVDQLQTSGLRARAQQIPAFEWEGVSLACLSADLVRVACDDYREMRAVLFFAADATCRSLWQDDLRGDD